MIMWLIISRKWVVWIGLTVSWLEKNLSECKVYLFWHKRSLQPTTHCITKMWHSPYTTVRCRQRTANSSQGKYKWGSVIMVIMTTETALTPEKWTMGNCVLSQLEIKYTTYRAEMYFWLISYRTCTDSAVPSCSDTKNMTLKKLGDGIPWTSATPAVSPALRWVRGWYFLT